MVRELHVYGTAIPVHARDPSKFQHQGFGMLLMEEAARIAREEHGSDKIAVISGRWCCIAGPPLRHGVHNIALWDWAGVGTRHYYRKMGYEIDGPYMSKILVPSCTS